MMRIRQGWVWAALAAVSVTASAQTDAAKPLHIRVSSGVADGLKIHDVAPKYPKEAKEKHIQGDVMLLATIDTKGKIAAIKVLQGEPILADAALTAVKKWKYRPYILNGNPVTVDTTLKIRFHL